MKTLRFVFISYAPMFLLTPFSIAVGFYVIKDSRLLSDPENIGFFYFYVFFTIMPLYFLFFHSRQDFGKQVFDILSMLFERFSRYKLQYSLLIIAFSGLYFWASYARIPVYYERDMWILENQIPILPIDVIIPQRLAFVVQWFAPMVFVVSIPNFGFILLWLAFLVYIGGESENGWLFVTFAFISTFFSLLLFQTTYASFEFPSAVLGFIGVYAIWKRKINLGLFFLFLSPIIKNTGAFQVVVGLMLLLFIVWQDGNFRKVLSSLDVPLIIFSILYLVANYWGHIYYNLVLIDPMVLVAPVSNQVFWFSSFFVFVNSLITGNTLIFILGVFALLLDRRYRLFSSFSFGLLLFVRSLSVRADAGYAAMFVPVLSFLSIYGVSILWRLAGSQWKKLFLLVLLLGANGFFLFRTLSHFPNGMNRLNSNFDQFVWKLTHRFPEVGTIYQYDISLMPYFYLLRGQDLDAIRFHLYPQDRERLLFQLSEPGCKLIIARKENLSRVGVYVNDILSLGYSEDPYRLVDQSGEWVSYSKECNAWEYK